MEGLETNFWDGAKLGGDLFVAGFGGIWRLPSEQARWSGELSVSDDIFRVLSLPWSRPLLMYADQSHLYALDKVPMRGWVPRELGQELAGAPLSVVRGADGRVWVSTAKNAILEYELATVREKPALRLLRQFEPGVGEPFDVSRPILTRLGSSLFVFSENSTLRLNGSQSLFSPVKEMEPWAGLAAAEAEDGSSYWLVRPRVGGLSTRPGVLRAELRGDLLNLVPLAIGETAAVGRVTSLSATHETGTDILWLGGDKGVLRIVAPDAAPTPPVVHLRMVEIEGAAMPLSAAMRNMALPGRTRRVHLAFGAEHEADDLSISYQTWLEGADSGWSVPQPEGDRNYPGLGAGGYIFRARALDALGRPGPELSVAFAIPMPWFLRWWAFAAYAAALASAVAILARSRIRKLQFQAAKLNRLVDERTRELSLANAAKTEFLETISHEIRNPLNGIRGFVSMLREAPLQPKQRENAASLAACAAALTRVFDEVLGFAKIESGQLPVQRRTFRLPGLIDEVAALHRVAARQRGCELRIHWENPAENASRFVGDDDRIKTVVGNLLSNAIKYAPGKPVDITVDCEPDGTRAADVTITVSDHGPGVPPEEQDLIFNKFVRGTNAKTGRVPGTGLGLATCRALSEQMGGFVGLESEPGEGSAFFLKLSLRRDLTPEEPAAAAEYKNGRAPAAPGAQRALIIEDQDYNQVVTLRIVQQLGLDAEVAQDGEEAKLKLETGPFAALFVDWEMPGLKGDEIARMVRKLPWGEDAVIIGTTGHDSESVRRPCLEAGMDALVMKPFDEATLGRALEEAQARRGKAGVGRRGQSGLLDVRIFALVGKGDPTKTTQAASDYLASLKYELENMDRALAAGDIGAAAGAAHRLRSHAGIVGAQAMRDAAQAFQKQAPEAPPAKRAELRDELLRQAEFVRVQIEMATGAGVL